MFNKGETKYIVWEHKAQMFPAGADEPPPTKKLEHKQRCRARVRVCLTCPHKQVVSKSYTTSAGLKKDINENMPLKLVNTSHSGTVGLSQWYLYHLNI